MKVVTTAEMHKIELSASNDFHISPLILMENAGKEAAFFILHNILGVAHKKRVLIVAGKGNNAGDGFVLARHLSNMGIQTRLFLLHKPEEFSADALQNYRIIESMGIRMQGLNGERDLQTLKIALLNTDLAVDAVFGTGFRGVAPSYIGKIFDIINSSRLPVVALDIPSGVEADTGKVEGKAINATWTLAMGMHKLGTTIGAGSSYSGKVEVLDISIPQILLKEKTLKHNIITEDLCKEIKLTRTADSHKGNYGHLLTIGGSVDMSGAAVLTAKAGMRSGCGIVTLALPKSLRAFIAPMIPHIMTKNCPETAAGSFSLAAISVLQPLLEKVEGVVVGPGMTRHQETLQLAQEVLKLAKTPVVMDADALYTLKDNLKILKERHEPIVLTPHPGEMAMLTGLTTKEIQNNRLEVARNFAMEYEVVLVLKGYRTIIATPLGETYISICGSTGMAKAGSGDVLAGLIGGLLTQGLQPEHAAILGVFLHSRSGEVSEEKLSAEGMHALDLVDNITQAWLEID